MSEIDLSESLSSARFAQVEDAFNEFGLLLFRRQQLSPADLSAFARRFPNDGGPAPYRTYLHPEHDDVTVLGNTPEDKRTPTAYLNKIGIEWHTDGTSSPRPAVVTLLYCVEAPSVGGETLFASGYAAWDAQPPNLKPRLEGLRVRYDFDQLLQRQAIHNGVPLETLRKKWRNRFEPIEHPLVRVHPVSGRTALWVTWAEMDRIVGRSREESLELVMSLVERGTTDDLVYAHAWQPGDLVIWDNRCMLHSTTPYTYADERRLMYRVSPHGDCAVG